MGLSIQRVSDLRLTSTAVSGPPTPQKKHALSGRDDNRICLLAVTFSRGTMYPGSTMALPSRALTASVNTGFSYAPNSSFPSAKLMLYSLGQTSEGNPE